MKRKFCSKCGDEKLLGEFHNSAASRDGKRPQCISCEKLRKEIYYINNKNKVKKSVKTYNKNNKEKVALFKKKYAKKYALENKKIIQKREKEYRKNNKKRIRTWNSEYSKKRRKTDKIFKLRINVSNMIRDSFRRNGLTKNMLTSNIIGCSFIELKNYLEKQFLHWMNWENKGLYNGQLNHGWDIDHIIPISSAKTIEDVIRLNHHTNLQPLCSYINRDVKKASI